jgi:hypothetical protein
MMFITGQYCLKPGIYRSLCACRWEIPLLAREYFPPCTIHGHVTWMYVRPH